MASLSQVFVSSCLAGELWRLAGLTRSLRDQPVLGAAPQSPARSSPTLAEADSSVSMRARSFVPLDLPALMRLQSPAHWQNAAWGLWPELPSLPAPALARSLGSSHAKTVEASSCV